MPVVVTGAGTAIGRALVERLGSIGGEVRAVVPDRAHAEHLRALGAKTAVGALSDLGTLGVVMADAHTVCHLAGAMRFDGDVDHEEVVLRTAQGVLETAVDAPVTRFVLLSHVGADPASPNAYLRSCGQSEDAVRTSGLQHVILRTTLVYGGGSPWLEYTVAATLRRVATVVGNGSQRLRPVFVSDVAAAVAAADDRAAGVSGTYGLEGPDEVTADELLDLVAGKRKRKLHLPAAAARRLPGGPSPEILEILAEDSLADAPDAADEFGIDRTPLREGLAKSGLSSAP